MATQLIHADCLTVDWPQVDAIITDIPYGTTACKWDVIIPFDAMWAKIKGSLKPRGAFVTTASQPFTSALVMSNPKWFKYEWIFDKYTPSGFMNAKTQPLKQHENILIFSKNGHLYNPQKFKKPYKAFRDGKGFIKEGDPVKTGIYGDNIVNGSGVRSEYSYPKTIIQYKAGNGWDKKKNVHPTQKPVMLYEYLIKTYTNEGDTVLDFCMGSGTTGVACLNTGRNFIGIEKDDKYYNIAKDRINGSYRPE
jgi:site-specific DNA-methyltransferase (adenine-specific)